MILTALRLALKKRAEKWGWSIYEALASDAVWMASAAVMFFALWMNGDI